MLSVLGYEQYMITAPVRLYLEMYLLIYRRLAMNTTLFGLVADLIILKKMIL